MKKYRIVKVYADTKDILLECNDGTREIINEGVFKDTFVKTKDAIIDFVRKGKSIVVKLGDMITKAINSVFAICKNRPKGVHIFLSDADLDIATELGIADTNDDFEDYVKKSLYQNNMESVENIFEAISWFSAGFLNVLDGVNEGRDDSESEWPFAVRKEAFRMMFPNMSRLVLKDRSEETQKAKETTATGGMSGSENYTIDYPDMGMVPGVDMVNWTAQDIIDDLSSKFRYVFENEPKGVKMNRNNEAYTPLVIYGASGIGKTSIISQLAEKFGVKMIVLSGNYMNDYSMTSPSSTVSKIYQKDENGRYVLDVNGDANVVDEREAVDTVFAKIIPCFNKTRVIQEAQIEGQRNGLTDASLDSYVNDKVKSADLSLGKGILFFDEISRMPGNLIDSLMNIFDTGGVGDYVLGSNWAIAGALNPAFDKSERNIGEMLKKLQETSRQRRLERVNFIPCFTDFIARGKSKYTYTRKINGNVHSDENTRLHPAVIKFLDDVTRQYHMLNLFDKVPSYNVRGNVANPALWEKFSQALYLIDDDYIAMGKNKEAFENCLGYINRVIKKLSVIMPYETTEFKDWMTSDMLEFSDAMAAGAWSGARLERTNKTINNGRGIRMSKDEVFNKLWFSAPFVVGGTFNKEIFEKNRISYLTNLYDFITKFFNKKTDDTIKGQIMKDIDNKLIGEIGRNANGSRYTIVDLTDGMPDDTMRNAFINAYSNEN